MGEAPFFCVNDLQTTAANGFDLVSRGSQVTVSLGNKKYMIGDGDADAAMSIGLKVFEESAGEWICPTIVGTIPSPCSDFWTLALDKDRILIIKSNTAIHDRIWFLEVDTQFVRQQSKVFGTTVVAWSKGVCGYAGKPIVISGPSGVGKGTLISKLMKEFPSMFGFSVSHTTRAPRENEMNGIHYHFTNWSAMETDIRGGRFLEFASVHGNLYGTSVEAVEAVADAGKRCILDIDVQGARSVRASPVEAMFIFICPPSFEDLEKRLRSRGTETEEQIQKRLRNAKGEMEQGKSPGLFDHVLLNDDLDACYENLKEILGLKQSAGNPLESVPKDVRLPMIHSAAKVDHRIFLNCGAVDENPSKNAFVLDLSSLKGGAPGRTRGLRCCSCKPIGRVHSGDQTVRLTTPDSQC